MSLRLRLEDASDVLRKMLEKYELEEKEVEALEMSIRIIDGWDDIQEELSKQSRASSSQTIYKLAVDSIRGMIDKYLKGANI